jgi:O-antigen/teichoic acid export membrane protein
LNILLDKWGDRAPPLISTIMFILIILVLIPYGIGPVAEALIKTFVGIVLIIFSRDVLIVYGKKKRKPK